MFRTPYSPNETATIRMHAVIAKSQIKAVFSKSEIGYKLHLCSIFRNQMFVNIILKDILGLS